MGNRNNREDRKRENKNPIFQYSILKITKILLQTRKCKKANIQMITKSLLPAQPEERGREGADTPLPSIPIGVVGRRNPRESEKTRRQKIKKAILKRARKREGKNQAYCHGIILSFFPIDKRMPQESSDMVLIEIFCTQGLSSCNYTHVPIY